jgi:hypothetical protein
MLPALPEAPDLPRFNCWRKALRTSKDSVFAVILHVYRKIGSNVGIALVLNFPN